MVDFICDYYKRLGEVDVLSSVQVCSCITASTVLNPVVCPLAAPVPLVPI